MRRKEKAFPEIVMFGTSSSSKHCVLTLRLTHVAQKARTLSPHHQESKGIVRWRGRLYANLLPSRMASAGEGQDAQPIIPVNAV